MLTRSIWDGFPPPRAPGARRSTQKELTAYHKELAKQKEKVEGMRARAADEYDIKKQVRAGCQAAPSPARGAAGRVPQTARDPRRVPAAGRHSASQVEVQAETEAMIPDTMRRLAKGVEDLKGFLVRGPAPRLAWTAWHPPLASRPAGLTQRPASPSAASAGHERGGPGGGR